MPKIRKEGGKMVSSVQRLQIMEIKEQSIQAYNATNKLLGNVQVLTTTLKRIDMTKLTCISTTLEQSAEAAKEATKNSSGLATAMEKLGQKMPNIKNAVVKITQSVPNIKTVIDGILKKLPDVKKAMEDIYKATESHIFTHFTIVTC